MVSHRDIAYVIIEEIRENKDVTKNLLIDKVSKRTNIGSTTVREILSQLIVLKIVEKRTIQRAQVHTVNEKNIDEIKKIED